MPQSEIAEFVHKNVTVKPILLDWSCRFKLNGALVPDRLVLTSSLQPQTVAEEQADPLTSF